MREKYGDKFTGKMFGRLLAPSIASALGLALADMADAVVIGQRMGATGLAAVSISLPVFMVINVLVHGLGIGGSVKYSRYLGEGEEEKAVTGFNQILGAAVGISLLLAILGNLFLEPLMAALGVTREDGKLFAASSEYVRIIITGMPALFVSYILNYYLRNDDNQKLASFGFTVSNLSDVAMNILFVLIMGKGAAGAAMATVLGQVLAILLYLPGVTAKRNILKIKPVRIDIREIWGCFRTGFSTSVQYIWQLIFLLIMNHTLMYYSGETGVAVFDIVQNVSYLILYLYDGTAKAMQPLISTYWGEKNEAGMHTIRKIGLRCGTAAGLIAIMFLCIFPQVMCRVFGITEPDVLQLANNAIRIYCLGALFGGINIILEGFYQSCEDEKPAFLMATLRGAAVLIPCTVLFAPLGIRTFWFLFPATEILSLLIFQIWNRRRKKSTFDQTKIYRKTVENRNEDMGEMLREVEGFCEAREASMKQTYFVTMTVEEICSLIISKAFGSENKGYIEITLIALDGGEFELHIRDNASIFNPFSMETNRVSREGNYDMDAMGMLVIRQKAKQFYYRQYQGFNSLIVKI